MPIEEFLDYAKLLYDYRKNSKTKSNTDGGAEKKPDGKSIGQVIPNFNSVIK